MSKNLYISGIGGWLAFLIFGMMVFWPLVQFGQMSNEFRNALEKLPELAANPEWIKYKQVSWLIFTASSMTSFAAGYRLWKIHFPDSVRFTVLALWLSGPGADLAYSLAALIIFNKLSTHDALTAMTAKIVMSLLITGVWVAYLKLSIRVKNTYKC